MTLEKVCKDENYLYFPYHSDILSIIDHRDTSLNVLNYVNKGLHDFERKIYVHRIVIVRFRKVSYCNR